MISKDDLSHSYAAVHLVCMSSLTENELSTDDQLSGARQSGERSFEEQVNFRIRTQLRRTYSWHIVALALKKTSRSVQ